MHPSLPDIAQTILAAHRAAAHADQLATIAIRMLVKKRVEAAVALSEARGRTREGSFYGSPASGSAGKGQKLRWLKDGRYCRGTSEGGRRWRCCPIDGEGGR
jgi:hypothetical protein